MKKQAMRYGILSGLIAVCILAGDGSAKISEPDNILYGMLPDGVSSISLKIGGDVIVVYARGEVPAAGDHFVLRVPIDAVDPREPGTACPGEQATLFLDAAGEPEISVMIGERGTVQEIFLADADSDGDNDLNGEDNCPGIANDDQSDVNGNGVGDACDPSDSDGDGYSDMLEYSYIAISHKDPEGSDYALLTVNAPGDEGYSMPGDIDETGIVDLIDVILVLQVVTGSLPEETVIFVSGDINDDFRIGLEEAVYALQMAAGI